MSLLSRRASEYLDGLRKEALEELIPEEIEWDDAEEDMTIDTVARSVNVWGQNALHLVEGANTFAHPEADWRTVTVRDVKRGDIIRWIEGGGQFGWSDDRLVLRVYEEGPDIAIEYVFSYGNDGREYESTFVTSPNTPVQVASNTPQLFSTPPTIGAKTATSYDTDGNTLVGLVHGSASYIVMGRASTRQAAEARGIRLDPDELLAYSGRHNEHWLIVTPKEERKSYKAKGWYEHHDVLMVDVHSIDTVGEDGGVIVGVKGDLVSEGFIRLDSLRVVGSKEGRSYYSGDPRWITVKYRGVCADASGHPIAAGERGFYFPNGKHLYCEDHGEAHARQFESERADEDFMSGSYYSSKQVGNPYYTVICEDNIIRHDEPFKTALEAMGFADYDHACTATHTINHHVDGKVVERWDHYYDAEGKGQVREADLSPVTDDPMWPLDEDAVEAEDLEVESKQAAKVGEPCEVCGLVQSVTEYCVVSDGEHYTYESDFSPTRKILESTRKQAVDRANRFWITWTDRNGEEQFYGTDRAETAMLVQEQAQADGGTNIKVEDEVGQQVFKWNAHKKADADFVRTRVSIPTQLKELGHTLEVKDGPLGQMVYVIDGEEMGLREAADRYLGGWDVAFGKGGARKTAGDWRIKCLECGHQFPITEEMRGGSGRSDWVCPSCGVGLVSDLPNVLWPERFDMLWDETLPSPALATRKQAATMYVLRVTEGGNAGRYLLSDDGLRVEYTDDPRSAMRMGRNRTYEYVDSGPYEAIPYSEATTATRKQGSIPLTRIRWTDDPNIFIGQDPSGSDVSFRVTDADAKSLKSIMLSDLSVNFSGVDIEESDIVTMAARSDYEHWNEDQDLIWWQEEGRHTEDPDDWYDPYNDDGFEDDLDIEASRKRQFVDRKTAASYPCIECGRMTVQDDPAWGEVVICEDCGASAKPSGGKSADERIRDWVNGLPPDNVLDLNGWLGSKQAGQRPSVSLFSREHPYAKQLLEDGASEYEWGSVAAELDFKAGLPALSDDELANLWHSSYTEGYLDYYGDMG